MKKILLMIFWILPMFIGGMTMTDAHSQIAAGVIWAGDTVGHSAPDTLSRFNPVSITSLLSKWNRTWSFAIYADSTLEISDTAAFSRGRTLKITGGISYRSEQLDVSVFRDLYIRKYGTATGTVQYVISAKGY